MGKSKTERFNLEMAHYMVDEYLKMASYSHENVSQKKGVENSGSIALAISNYAFAIEILLKALIFTQKEAIFEGHDLAFLWNQQNQETKEWISKQFDLNFDKENETWSVLAIFAPQKAGWKQNLNFKTRENSAVGMIKSHKLAFEHGRYAYEQPSGGKIKGIQFNLNGLRLLATIIRGVSLHLYIEKKIKGGSMSLNHGEKTTFKIKFPTSLSPLPAFKKL